MKRDFTFWWSKARLSLASLCSSRCFLLDDPLSAVDEHVGKHLTDHVLGPNGLLKSKCKILATNNIKVLSIADTLNLVSDGRLIEQGSYDDIMKQESSKIRQLIESFGKKKMIPQLQLHQVKLTLIMKLKSKLKMMILI